MLLMCGYPQNKYMRGAKPASAKRRQAKQDQDQRQICTQKRYEGLGGEDAFGYVALLGFAAGGDRGGSQEASKASSQELRWRWNKILRDGTRQ